MDCDDYNAGTDDSCDSSSGCLYTVFDCDETDSMVMNLYDEVDCWFDAVNGISHDFVDCDDSNAYAVDSCDVESGCESYDLNCVDSDACTTDSCNPETGCQ
jgi:hypothetical protein